MDNEVKASLFSYIEDHRKDLVSFLQTLLRIDTQTPPGRNYDTICRVIGKRLAQHGCRVEYHDAPEKYLELSGAKAMGLEGPRTNVVARYPGPIGGPFLHISAHTDTAAIQTEGWSVDPLGGDVTKDCRYGRSPYDRGGGYIWGRGTSDDKGEVAAMALAVQAIHELGLKLGGTLVLTGNCDEEIGGIAGLGFLIREGIVKADYGVQLDGGLNGIGLAAQGRVRFRLRTLGKAYHGQLPVLGINAIEKMSRINVALTDYWRNVLLKKQMPVPGVELPAELAKLGVDKLTAMLNIGTIQGGVQGATVPDKCEEEILRGMIPGESFEEVQKEIINVIEGVRATDPNVKYELEVINVREGYVVSAQDPYALKAQATIQEVVSKELPFTATLASTDMNYQVVDGKMPCVNFGIGGAYSRGHQQDESASIDEIIDCTKSVALLITRTLGTK